MAEWPSFDLKKTRNWENSYVVGPLPNDGELFDSFSETIAQNERSIEAFPYKDTEPSRQHVAVDLWHI